MCAYNCTLVKYTLQLIMTMFSFILQSIITAQTLPIGEERAARKTEQLYQ